MKNIEIVLGRQGEGNGGFMDQLERALEIDDPRSAFNRNIARVAYEAAWEKLAKNSFITVRDVAVILYPSEVVELIQTCDRRKLKLRLSSKLLVNVKDALAKGLGLSPKAATNAMSILFPDGKFVHDVD